jgi:hypothetical protein
MNRAVSQPQPLCRNVKGSLTGVDSLRELGVEVAQTPGEITRDVQQEMRVVLGRLFVEMQEIERGQRDEFGFSQALHRGRAGECFQDAHFAKKIAVAKASQFGFFSSAHAFDDADDARCDQIKSVAWFAFADDGTNGRHEFALGFAGKNLQSLLAQPHENRNHSKFRMHGEVFNRALLK